MHGPSVVEDTCHDGWVFTLLPGEPVSSTDVLHHEVHLPESWWEQLRANLDELRTTPSSRINADQGTVSLRSQAAFRADLWPS